ncbi:site-specific integrase [Sansalvadorimonas verongulae]|uniref:site-specific integrase n=1 Tax=Sansalvadorimonas verongulae TaxID=2172824 RepID=UPI0012BCC5E4|nr:site-specific integrase [Sansalvadorimonas verongulae]MTI15121.1 DUF3596 domain-containing protein [Sansalvadorimonas verongulae]
MTRSVSELNFDHLPRPKSVRLRVFAHTLAVVVNFTYRGHRIREVFVRRDLPVGGSSSELFAFENRLLRDMKEAAALLKSIRDEIAHGIFDLSLHFPESKSLEILGMATTKPRDTTVAGYLNRYLERAKTTTRAVTAGKYEKMVNSHLLPVFGHLQANELTAGMIRDWAHTRSLKTRRKTLSNILSPLRMAMDDAVLDEVITTNPVRKIKLDNIVAASSRGTGFKVDPFTQSGRDKLLAVMESPIRNMFQFAFYTGLRTSELLGLTWDKVDFHNRQVLVDQAMVEGNLGPVKTAGKGAEERKVLLLDPAFEALQAQRAHTQLLGETSNGDNFVFRNPRTGQHWQDDTELRRQAWQPAFKRSGVRYRNPYQTRHTYAHILIRQNENLWWIANQMGHVGIEMLNRHYGGWLEDYDKQYLPKRLFKADSAEPAKSVSQSSTSETA